MGVAGQARIIDAFYFWMSFEEFRYALAIFVQPLHADSKGFQAPNEQVRRMRVYYAACDFQVFADWVDEFLFAENNAREQVIVSAEIFCGTVYDEVYAVIERFLIVWCGEGAVGYNEDIGAFEDIH